MKTFFNHPEHEDSTWKIVYMDMITMLMILFLSLWVIDQGKAREPAKRGDVTLTKVEIESDDYFMPGKFDLKKESLQKLNDLFFKGRNSFPAPGVDLEAGGRRVILIHGHTDDQGLKDDNFELGFQRAMSVYHEIQRNVPNLADNVGICSFADNFPLEKVRTHQSKGAAPLTDRQIEEIMRKRRKNRRFELVGQFEELPEGDR